VNVSSLKLFALKMTTALVLANFAMLRTLATMGILVRNLILEILGFAYKINARVTQVVTDGKSARQANNVKEKIVLQLLNV
jgi:hypothetical protein